MGIVGCHGIYFQNYKGYVFWVRIYFEEFKNAANYYIDGLERRIESLDSLEKALKARPTLL